MGQRKTNFWRIITHLIFYICLGLVMFFSINYIFTQIILIAMVLFLRHTQQECPYKTEPISFPTWTMIVLGTYLLCYCFSLYINILLLGLSRVNYLETVSYILWIGFFVALAIVLLKRRKHVLKEIDYILILLLLFSSPTISCVKKCSINWCRCSSPQPEINFIFNNIQPWCDTVLKFSVTDYHIIGNPVGCDNDNHDSVRFNLDFFKDIFSEFWYGMQFLTIIIALVVTVLYVQYRKRKTRELIEKTQEEGLSIQN